MKNTTKEAQSVVDVFSRDVKYKRKCVYFFRTNRRNQKAYTEQVDNKNKLYNIQDKQNTKYEI